MLPSSAQHRPRFLSRLRYQGAFHRAAKSGARPKVKSSHRCHRSSHHNRVRHNRPQPHLRHRHLRSERCGFWQSAGCQTLQALDDFRWRLAAKIDRASLIIKLIGILNKIIVIAIARSCYIMARPAPVGCVHQCMNDRKSMIHKDETMP